MMEKLAQAGKRLPPSTLSTIMYKVVVYAPAERADISALPLYVLCELHLQRWCGGLTPAWGACAAYPVVSPPAG